MTTMPTQIVIHSITRDSKQPRGKRLAAGPVFWQVAQDLLEDMGRNVIGCVGIADAVPHVVVDAPEEMIVHGRKRSPVGLGADHQCFFVWQVCRYRFQRDHS
jgi:hypothetical protein